jgi:hypothetical protein
VRAHVVNNRVYVDAEITWDGITSYAISNMAFLGTMPANWDRNFNSNAFEIIGPDKLPVFQEIYILPEHIVLNGIFPKKPGIIVGVFDAQMRGGFPDEVLTNFPNRKPIFKYPSWKFPGVLADQTEHTESGEHPAIIVNVQQQGYIEGTDITHKQLQEVFPFGYAVIYLGQNKRFRYEVFKNGLMDWKIDLDKVTIDPDFASGKVTWKIQPTSAEGQAGQIQFVNSTVSVICPMKNGTTNKAGFIIGNNPVPYVATLNADQRNPVFALGFRIPSSDEHNYQP